ncbi:MAG: DUF87 domain-containing protein, partial [bacterium]|nr:DUF87 domain-containing protein [bacterium]
MRPFRELLKIFKPSLQAPCRRTGSIEILHNSATYNQGRFNRVDFCIKDPNSPSRSSGFYKSIKLLKVTKVPQQLRERRSLLSIHSEVLSGLWSRDIVFINIIANIVNPVYGSRGLLFLYGVEGIGATESNSIKNSEEGFASLSGLLQGNFKQLKQEDLTKGDYLEISERMENFTRLMVIRGIPGTRAGTGTTAQSELSINSDPTEEVNEEFIRGLLHDEYILLSVAVPVNYETLNFWIQETSEKLSAWKSDIEGMKSISAGISVPFMMIGMLGRQVGNSVQDSNSFSESNSVSDALSEGMTEGNQTSHTEGENLSNSITETEGNSESHSIASGMSDSIGDNLGYTKGNNFSHGDIINHSDSMQNNHTDSQSNQESFSFSEMNSETQHHSVTQSQSFTRSHSETNGVGQNVSISQNWGTSMNRSSSFGQNWQQSLSEVNSITNSQSSSSGVTESLSKTDYNNFYQSSFSKPAVMESGGLNNSHGWNVNGGINASIEMLGIFGKGGYNESTGNNNGFNQMDNGSYMDFMRLTKETLPESNLSNPYKVFNAQDILGNVSNEHPFGTSYTLYNGNPVTNGIANNISNSVGEAITKGLNVGNGIGGNVVETVAEGVSKNLGLTTGFSRQQSVTDGWSYSQGLAETYGTSQTTGTTEGQVRGYSETQSDGYSQGTTDGYSNSETQGNSQQWNSGSSINRGTNYTSSFSNGQNHSLAESQGTIKVNTVSHGESFQKSTGTTHTDSKGNVIGMINSTGYNRGINAGLSSSFGIAPSVMISHSRREYDEERESIARLYSTLKERLIQGLKTGIFSTATYLMTPDDIVAAKAKTLIRSAFINNELLSPIQVLEPKEELEKTLKIYMKTFSQSNIREDAEHPTESYKYCQTLLPSELAAFNHPPRIEAGGIYTTVENIPDSFALPSDRTGKIDIGRIISPETGDVTDFRFGLNERELVHTAIYGITGSGKTNGAIHYLEKIANTMEDVNINIFDFKNDWRDLFNVIENKERFRFFSLYNENLFPLQFNPLRVPTGIEPEEWKDTVTEVFCLENLLGEKQFGIIDQGIYHLYEQAGIFDNPDDAPSLSKKITLSNLYNHLLSELNTITSKNMIDSYYGILVRLRKYTNTKSKLYRLYS